MIDNNIQRSFLRRWTEKRQSTSSFSSSWRSVPVQLLLVEHGPWFDPPTMSFFITVRNTLTSIMSNWVPCSSSNKERSKNNWWISFMLLRIERISFLLKKVKEWEYTIFVLYSQIGLSYLMISGFGNSLVHNMKSRILLVTFGGWTVFPKGCYKELKINTESIGICV